MVGFSVVVEVVGANMSKLLMDNLEEKLGYFGFHKEKPSDKYAGILMHLYYERGPNEVVAVYDEYEYVHWVSGGLSGNDSLTQYFIDTFSALFAEETIEKTKKEVYAEQCEDCGSTDGVSYIEEPFEQEMNGISEMMWLCGSCYSNRAMEV